MAAWRTAVGSMYHPGHPAGPGGATATTPWRRQGDKI